MRMNVSTFYPRCWKASSTALSWAVRRKRKELQKYIYIILPRLCHDRYHKVDDYPFGGFAGMVMKIEQ